MPLTKSTKKALRQSLKKRVRNLRKKRMVKDIFKQIEKSVSLGETNKAKDFLPKYYKALDKAAKTHVIKRNKAARKKSQAAKILNRSLAPSLDTNLRQKNVQKAEDKKPQAK